MADENVTPAPGDAGGTPQTPPTATPQPQGAQAGTADPWNQIKEAGFTPQDVARALMAQQQMDEIEQQGGIERLIQERALGLTEEKIAELRKTPKGRDLLRRWAGSEETEEQLTPEEKRIRALEEQLADLKKFAEKNGETGKEAYLRSQAIENENRWERELNEVLTENPDLAPFKADLRADLLRAIANNPREFGGPGWIRQASKGWYDRALSVHRVLSERSATKGRVAPGSGGGGIVEKKPEEMSDDEVKNWNYKHFGI